MNSNLIIREFEQQEVRMLIVNGEPVWVAKDVCDILDHSNSRMAIQSLEDDEKCVRKVYTPGGEQEMACINEAGLYTLIIRSNKPQAKLFRKWVTHEILPEIRRTGGYNLPQNLPEALRALADKTEEAERIEDERKRLELENDRLNPLALAYRNLVETEGLYSWSEASKVLSNQFPGIGRNRLTALLKEHGYLMRSKACEPYQRYVERGLFRVKLVTYTDGEGNQKSITTTLTTLKGLDKIRAILSGTETLDVIADPEPIRIAFDLNDFIDTINVSD